MDEVTAKKQRVSFADEDIPSSNNNLFGFKANNIIDLVFIESCKLSADRHKPDFTHQLFENETVQLFTNINGSSHVRIEVDCFDLSCMVSYPATLSTRDVETLSDGIHKALPATNKAISSVGTSGTVGNVIDVSTAHAPPGTQIHRFSVGAVDYELWLATAKDPGASELLHRAEKLAMWFIETADSVDFSDDRWEVLFLYASYRTPDNASKPPKRYFAGYMTLFSFRNPFRGTKLRVCQALVLPHRQGHGLGREMLLCVYKHIVQPRGDICELTVEDPAVGFQRLRDAVDLELFASLWPELFASDGALAEPMSVGVATKDPSEGSSSNAVPTSPPTEQEICTALKIIKTQAQFLLECVDYVKLVRSLLSQAQGTNHSMDCMETTPANAVKRPLHGEHGEDHDKMERIFKLLETNDAFKTFRLKVKRRILKNDKELSAIAPKAAMQKALSEEFAIELKRFHALESAAKRLGLIHAKLDSLL